MWFQDLVYARYIIYFLNNHKKQQNDQGVAIVPHTNPLFELTTNRGVLTRHFSK